MRFDAPKPLRAVLFALCVLSGSLVGGAASVGDALDLPDMGNSADAVLTLTEQRELGQEFMKWVRKSLDVSEDPLLTDYVQSLGRKLVAASRDTRGRYDFFVVEDPRINAFAGPSGNIGVNAGLILAAETESELAAVMAHEVAHVSQRHLLRAFAAQKQMTIPATALLIAAAVLGATVDSQVGTAALMGLQGAMVQRQINFTRANEEEADSIGIDTLARAGHDPYAMPGFFNKLTKANRVYESGAPELLRTHPVTSDRIADAMARAERFGHSQRPDSLRFHLTRAHLRERSYNRAEQAIGHFKNTLARGRYRNETAERYGYARALARAGSLGDAAEQLAPLIEKHPSQVELVVLQAELDRRRGAADKAARDLKSAVGLAPGSWPLQQAYAEALLDAGRPAEALATLERLVALRPDITPVYQIMADAAGKVGDAGAAMRWRAEYLYRSGDLEPAVRQLELALRQPGLDFHLASKIQVRLAELRTEEQSRKKPR
ncbi:M48 family metalloprotease [Thiohalocapsa sp. ML1]|jgi:beta-barrel assembly-enhancing protease|uniref:M48 family metalloprotease n=1 Tax=Thiohalocapsa sp. ML1 TaxID=1431688 RepID=UPI0007323184|nr:M48 family metalloprotease [Thiohalocapsa sp. ML1]